MRNNDHTDNSRERFDEYLRQNRKRRTPERFAILEMAAATAGHFTADDMGEMLRKREFPVSSATIYSTLNMLVDFGLLVKQRFGNQACLYERASTAAGATHHHLICESCGKIKEVRDPLLTRQIHDKRFSGFNQSYYTLNIYGVCSACAKKKKRK